MDGCPDLHPEQDCTGPPDESVHDGQHAGNNVGLGGFPGVVLVMLEPEQTYFNVFDVLESLDQSKLRGLSTQNPYNNNHQIPELRQIR